MVCILLLGCLSMFLGSCAQKEECDFCGEIGKCDEKNFLGENILICEDCLNDLGVESKFSNDDWLVFDDEDLNDEEKAVEELRKYYTKVNVFKDVEVVFNGINGQGQYSIINNSEDPFTSQVSFFVDEDNSDNVYGELTNGDNVVITACSEELSDEYECVIKTVSKTFEVSELPISVTAKDLTSEFIEQIKQYAYEILIEHTESEARYYDYNNIKYECTYFCDNEHRNSNYTVDNPKTKLAVFFSLDRTDYNNDVIEPKYYVVTFSSLRGEMVLSSDGTYKVISGSTKYDINTELGSVGGWGDTLDEAIIEVTPLFEDESYYTKAKID